MMGQQTGDQASLFYEFRLEDRVPKEHLLRRINVFVTAVISLVRQLKPSRGRCEHVLPFVVERQTLGKLHALCGAAAVLGRVTMLTHTC